MTFSATIFTLYRITSVAYSCHLAVAAAICWSMDLFIDTQTYTYAQADEWTYRRFWKQDDVGKTGKLLCWCWWQGLYGGWGAGLQWRQKNSGLGEWVVRGLRTLKRLKPALSERCVCNSTAQRERIPWEYKLARYTIPSIISCSKNVRLRQKHELFYACLVTNSGWRISLPLYTIYILYCMDSGYWL